MNPKLLLQLLSLGSRGLKFGAGLAPKGYAGRAVGSKLFKSGHKLETTFKKKYADFSRESLKKELLTKPAYNRFLESRRISMKDLKKENQKLIDDIQFHDKQIKFWRKTEKTAHDAIKLQPLTGKPSHIQSIHEAAVKQRLAHENMRNITNKKISTLKNDLADAQLTEQLGSEAWKGGVSFKAYKKDVASIINKTPIKYKRNLTYEGRSILGVYHPFEREVGLNTARMLKERGMFRLGGKSTGRHELKHAVQHQMDPGGAYERIFKANYPKGFNKKHFNANRKYYDKRLHGYEYDQLPEEASARLSELRGLPPSVLRKIRNNPGGIKAQSHAPVRWLTTIFGTGDKFRKILDKAWAIPVAYGAKRSLLDEAVDYNE